MFSWPSLTDEAAAFGGFCPLALLLACPVVAIMSIVGRFSGCESVFRSRARLTVE